MPIINGKYKNPNWVNDAPPAIDAGELNAMSDTIERLDGEMGNMVTLLASDWVEGIYNLEDIYPSRWFNVEISLVEGCTKDQYEAWGKAMIVGSISATQLQAVGEVPTIDIPVYIKAYSLIPIQELNHKVVNGKTWFQSGVTSGRFDLGIEYGDGLWLTHNYDDNRFYASSDGVSWTGWSSLVNAGVIRYANGLWVTGATGLYYSTNGYDWTISNITSGTFYDIKYADGLWVAGGRDNGLYYSTNGKNWTQSNITTAWVDSICYGNGLWVAGISTSENGDTQYRGIWYSTNGKTWTRSDALPDNVSAVYYANNFWVAGGQGYWYSIDGKAWTRGETNATIDSFCFANGTWVSVGASGIDYSSDGKTWTSSNITNGDVRTVCYANGMWVAGGTRVYYSSDGKIWTESEFVGEYGQYMYQIINVNGIWIGGTHKNGLYYSPTWALA